MQFEFSLENLHFYIELVETPKHLPDLKHSDWIEEDLDLWREGKLTYFQMMIISENPQGEQLRHYVPAILLPQNNEQELQDRIELFMDGPSGLDKILSHWEHLEEEDDTPPEWAK